MRKIRVPRALKLAAAGLVILAATWFFVPRPGPDDGPTEAPAASIDGAVAATLAEDEPLGPPERDPDIVFVRTPTEVVDRMLRLAELKPGDVLYDLGCGDGQIVVTAARRYGVHAVGIEIDPKLVRRARENARRSGVQHLVEIRQVDLFKVDLRDADVVTMYLLPRLNAKLKPRLAKLRPGSRVISHSFDMAGAKPESVTVVHCADEFDRPIYRWIVPWEAADP